MKHFCLLIIIAVLISCNERTKEYSSQRNDKEKNTNIFVRWDTSLYNLNSASFSLYNQELGIILDDTNNCMNGIYMQLDNKKNKWRAVRITQNCAITDCLFVASQYKLLEQKISFNKTKIKEIDEEIWGNINLKLLGRNAFFREPEVLFIDNRRWDTVTINGQFFAGKFN